MTTPKHSQPGVEGANGEWVGKARVKSRFFHSTLLIVGN